jgi:hypothetical protein
LLALEAPVAGRCAEPVGLPPVVQKVAPAASSSVAAPAPFLALAPGAARPVLPEVSARQAQGLLRAGLHEELRLGVVEAVPTDAAAVAAGSGPDVVVAAALPVVPAGPPSEPPWGAVWVFRQDPAPLWPVRPRSAPTARAMGLSPVAWRSELSWQAALVVVLSCALGPGKF